MFRFAHILGSTAEGQTVAQDFYQDGEKPQTAPFILNPGHEEDFEETCINGRNIWFNRDGSVSQIALVSEGKRQGWGLMVKDGRYFVAARDGVETGGAWLSTARVVKCWVKSRNERNPYGDAPRNEMTPASVTV